MIHEIDAHVDTHLTAGPQTASKSVSQESAKLFDICQKYKAVEPVLKFVKGLLFWRPKWQQVIQQLIDSLDTICP